MKTCISSYSYSPLLRSGKMSYFDVIEKTKELGFDAIEFSIGDELPGGRETVAKLRDKCKEVGLPVASYTTGANFLVADVEKEIERVKEHVDRAEILGAPVMRHDICYGFYEGYEGVRTFDAIVPIIAPAIREVTEYAKTKGIRTMSENHGYFAQDADRLAKVFTAVGSTNYGWLCDVGNFCCADEDSAISVGKLAPLCFHCHVKDMFLRSGLLPDPGRGWGRTRGGNYFRGTIFGQGNIPTFQCLQTLKRNGYDGYISLEFEGIEETLMAITIGKENMDRYLTMLG
ncbi:MAG: sugar phosphate isomerase/epimerase [Eubacteriales bacterium]|nr:sugar phosphate isomerase/epimerase [Clostridiales bacterium]MDY3071799.1 sugar phosphate isomerase/epimerase [Eubacteriales bacterium]MDY5016161.1 sugar phosphate isomerase/epimerase [Eubacteriales bacterium]